MTNTTGGFSRVLDHHDPQDTGDLHTALVLRGMVREEVAQAIRDNVPTAEEREWITLAMRREARREKLHAAIIEKSLAGLVWAGIVGIGAMAYEYLKAHGWKP